MAISTAALCPSIFLHDLHPTLKADENLILRKRPHSVYQLSDGAFLPRGEFRRNLLHSIDHRFHLPDSSGVFFSLFLDEGPLFFEDDGLIQKILQPVLVGFCAIADSSGKQLSHLLVDFLQPFLDISKAHAFTGGGGQLLFHRPGNPPDGVLLPHGLVHNR